MTCATTRNLRPQLQALDADVTEVCLAELGETAGRAATSCERRANVVLSATHDPRFQHATWDQRCGHSFGAVR